MNGDENLSSAEMRTLPLNGYVGFDKLPQQEVHKQLLDGFVFNILCVGETGLGKSTLIETLFNRKFNVGPSSNDNLQLKIRSNTFDLQERGVKLKLSVTETSGFGDQLNKEDSAAVIIDFIDRQFEAYLREEMKIKRDLRAYHDTRVHICLYFISPTGHSLKPLDVITLKALHSRVNIVPLIAKSDTITKSDLQKFKTRILSDLKEHDITICQFPIDEDEVGEANAKLNALIPFAVVGGDEIVLLPSSIRGCRTGRGRQYPWGSVCVDDETHCDTAPLRSALLLLNTEHLRQQSRDLHYENYRRRRLLELGFSEDSRLSLSEMFHRQRESLAAALRNAEELQRQRGLQLAREADAEVERDKAALLARRDGLDRQHADWSARLNASKRVLDEEIAQFERRKQQFQAAKAKLANRAQNRRDRGGGGGVGGGIFNSLNRHTP